MKFGKLIHGGDYSPEQWLHAPDILAKDIILMKEAGMNSATMGMFAWSALEPREGEFSTEWLADIMDALHKNGICTVLGTPTAARPAWLDEKYPQAMRVCDMGIRNRHGGRHNFCPSAPEFRARAEAVITALAEAVKGRAGLALWHINNELGGECYCEYCIEKFRLYLKERYGGIDKLNREWWTAFWSHTYDNFNQIEPPFKNGERGVHGLTLDWRRFTSANMLDYLRFETAILRRITPNVPITTNFMTLFYGLDYNEFAPELDVISWDAYPHWGSDRQSRADTAAEYNFHHSLMRSLKPGTPFMLMESAPSQVNWHPVNKLKRPGEHLLSCLQAVACGSDTVQYFQWRKSRGCYEQHHGAVVDHGGGNDTRVFREVAEVGKVLAKLSEIAGSAVKAEAALIFDWSNRWAIDDCAGLSQQSKKYEETCMALFRLYTKHGRAMDIVPPTADLSRYNLVVAPMLYLLPNGAAENLKNFVSRGGELISTYLTGYVNENTLSYLGGFPGDGLIELFGIRAEEIDPLYPSDRNSARCAGIVSGDFEVSDYCEILRLEGAEVVGRYGSDFYKGNPAVTINSYGKGRAWYAAARLCDEGMSAIIEAACKRAGIGAALSKGSALPEGVALYERESAGSRYSFYLNWADESKNIDVSGYDMLSERQISGALALPPLGAAVIKTAAAIVSGRA